MGKYSTVIGMDVHARSVTMRACIVETGEVKSVTLSDCPSPEAVFEWISSFPTPWHAAYESGCTGFALARALNSMGCDCDVIAVTTLKRSVKDKKTKSDKVDANVIMQEMLKSTHDYSCVWIPGEEIEGARALARVRADASKKVGVAKRQLLAFLLTKGYVWNEKTSTGKRRAAWCRQFMAWLNSISFDDPATQMAYQLLRNAASNAESFLSDADEAVKNEADKLRWKPFVDALSCLKGVSPTTAFLAAAEIGDFERFDNGRSVSSWIGCVSGDNSSGEKRASGTSCTKMGNSLLRRTLIEGNASIGQRTGRRKMTCCKLSDVPPDVIGEVDRANARLNRRFRYLTEKRGLRINNAKVAIVREEIRWIWWIGLFVQHRCRVAE